MTNEQLVLRIQAGEEVKKHMEQLYMQTKAFIHQIACRYMGKVELEDLEQEGYLALYPAIDGYNPAAGYKFLTYAEKWICQRMQRYVAMNASGIHVSSHGLERIRRYQKFCAMWHQETGEEAPDMVAASYLWLTREEIQEVKQWIERSRVKSLESPVIGIGGGEDAQLVDLIPGTENMEEEAIKRLDAKRLQVALWRCVDMLPEHQSMIIRKRYQENKAREAIGQELGVSREAVRQQEVKALRELRKPKHSDILRPFLTEEVVYSRALVGNGITEFRRTWTSSTERIALRLGRGSKTQ